MGAIQQAFNNDMGIDPKLQHIAEKLRGLSLLRRAKESAIKVMTTPVEDRAASLEKTIERINRLAEMPLPEFKDEE